jgi:hypothetical protein
VAAGEKIATPARKTLCMRPKNIFPRLTEIIKHTLVSIRKWYNFQIKPAHADVQHQGRKFLERAEIKRRRKKTCAGAERLLRLN